MFAGYLFLRFKDGREIRQINPSQTLMNLQYIAKDIQCWMHTVGWGHSSTKKMFDNPLKLPEFCNISIWKQYMYTKTTIIK